MGLDAARTEKVAKIFTASKYHHGALKKEDEKEGVRGEEKG